MSETNEVTETIVNALNPALAPWNTAAAVVGTGGGCTAIGIPVPDGGEILITDEEDGTIPDGSTTRLMVGMYDADGDATRDVVAIPVLDLGTLSFTLDAFMLGQ